MNHIPTKKQVQKVIDTFYNAIKISKENNGTVCIDMNMPNVSHKCDTPLCHSGWYLVGLEEIYLDNYKSGAMAIAHDLGFEYTFDLTDWAFKNPTIWGNVNGNFMFSHSAAFNKCENLYDIISHWEGVRDRLLN